MAIKPNRPTAVLLAQGLLLVFGLLLLVSLLTNLALITVRHRNMLSLDLLLRASTLGGVVLVLFNAFWGLQKRKLYGKWLAVVGLSFLWLLVVYIQIRPPRGPILQFSYNSQGEIFGAVLSVVFISALFLFLILKLALSKSVHAFFKERNNADERSNPL